MARPRKDGRRAIGIQGKKGYLYIVFSEPVIKNGVRKIEKRWIATGLADTPDNVKTASATRTKMLSKDPDTVFDRNVSLSDFMDHMLAKKKSGRSQIRLIQATITGPNGSRNFLVT